MDMERRNGLMDRSIKENGYKEKQTAMANFTILMAITIRESSQMINSTEKELLFTLMEPNT